MAIESRMGEPAQPTRRPPQHGNRTTPRGADQYVLACNARRDADDDAFAGILLLEQQVEQLRAELAWQQEHAATRTGKWVRSKTSIAAMVFATITWVMGWMFTPNGKAMRVQTVVGSAYRANAHDIWKTPHFMTQDLSQTEIDSIVARLVEYVPQKVK
ncbi:MAG: hypothetical protein ABJE47_21200 [bacterium]